MTADETISSERRYPILSTVSKHTILADNCFNKTLFDAKNIRSTIYMEFGIKTDEHISTGQYATKHR